MSADKPLAAVAQALGPMVTSVICTKSRHPRACDPQRLAEIWMPYAKELSIIPDAIDAVTYLLNTAAPEDLIAVTGSLFLVGELRASLCRLAPVPRPRARQGPAEPQGGS
jgi:dihydrofolate synthase/folylpolyglutamate synthase